MKLDNVRWKHGMTSNTVIDPSKSYDAYGFMYLILFEFSNLFLYQGGAFTFRVEVLAILAQFILMTFDMNRVYFYN